MKPTAFAFKQFKVEQHNCPMKVNTDGVLLGAWANADAATRILDIGTGTGVIALMMAQKNQQATIHALDIDEGAFLQATENFRQSAWSNRLTAFHTPLQQFQPSTPYDLIISNPPYFANSQPSPLAAKNTARHQGSLNLKELVQAISSLMSATGKACLILPCHMLTTLKNEIAAVNLFLTAQTDVFATADKPAYVSLLQIQRAPLHFQADSIIIQQADNSFSDAYRQLTKDFYLKF